MISSQIPFYQIAEINNDDDGKYIKTEGLINREPKVEIDYIDDNNRNIRESRELQCFNVQETPGNTNLCGIPRTLFCKYSGKIKLAAGDLIRFRGIINVVENHKQLYTLMCLIDEESLEFVDLQQERVTHSKSFFTSDTLKQLQNREFLLFFDFLNEKAAKEGFLLKRMNGFIGHSSVKVQCNHSQCCFNFNISIKGSGKDCVCSIPLQKNYELKHNHQLNTTIYTHKALPAPVKEEILLYRRAGRLSFSKIAILISAKHGLRLATQQIKQILENEDIDDFKTESEELIEFMETIHGKCFIRENISNGVNLRTAVATFTQKELRNLKLYGDVIAIDPTFDQMRTNWSIIPLTCIGPNRELLSAGVIYSASLASDFFHWVLEILTNDDMPCSEIIQTLISDDDQGLNGAFSINNNYNRNDETETVRKIKKLNRIKCYWHKKKKFIDLLRRSRISDEERENFKKQFHDMCFTRSSIKCQAILDSLKKDLNTPAMQSFLNSLELHLFAKSHIGSTLNLGYISSSMAESANYRYKSQSGEYSLTLKESRGVFIEVEEQSETNRNYIKNRKTHKISSPLMNQILEERVTVSIASAIAGSMIKSKRLILRKIDENNIQVKDPVQEEDFFVDIAKRKCSCFKCEQVGIPCSHLIAVFHEYNTFIHPRWRVGEQSLTEDDVINIRLSTSTKVSYSNLRISLKTC